MDKEFKKFQNNYEIEIKNLKEKLAEQKRLEEQKRQRTEKT